MSNLHVFDHPLIQHKLSILRDKDTSSKLFRELVSEIAMLMCYEATRDLPLEDVDVETPVAVARCRHIAGKKLAVVPILRAGLGMVEGMVAMMPNVKVGHVGLFRDPETLEPVKYYFKMPPDIAERDAIIVDPMLATGGSAAAAAKFLKEVGVKHIKLMSIIGAPEGVERMQAEHPDVDIYLAALDDHLNDHGYIVPASATPATGFSEQNNPRCTQRKRTGPARSFLHGSAPPPNMVRGLRPRNCIRWAVNGGGRAVGNAGAIGHAERLRLTHPGNPATTGRRGRRPYGRSLNVRISITVSRCAIAANFLPPLGSPERELSRRFAP